MFFKRIDCEETDRVVLKSFLGIEPEHYLAVIYGLALAALLFFVLVFPGLRRPGALGVFDSEPRGAAVRVDGVTLGATPCEIFLTRGTRRIEMVLPGFSPYSSGLEVPGRIFASALVPAKLALKGTLSSPDPAAALAEGAAEFAAWAAAGEPAETRQVPQVLSETVYRVAPAASGRSERDAMNGILAAAAPHAVTRAAARDLLRAKFLLDSGGLVPMPSSVINTIRECARSLSESGPAAAGWLGYLRGGPAFSAAETPSSITISEEAAGNLDVNGVRFIGVGGGRLTAAREEIIPSFYLAARETGIDQWEQWEQRELFSNADSRQAVTMYTDFPSYPEGAASGITREDAEAYCRWLGSHLPPALDGWEVRLPTEAEWEYAARYFSRASVQEKPVNLEGGLWEWCSGVYAPLDFFPPAPAVIAGPERPVRGGSWINPPGSVGIGTRGALPPDSASPFVGLRPVMARKR
ncbi:MAG: SUMF1/EgtB/PvdO family nonheme iron enzyme [Treponema sp.]|jgi:hypothetical protein|nr:SUMF1/EgtB/PvdO family nonheme iron enzyme [Treponema sp.]